MKDLKNVLSVDLEEWWHSYYLSPYIKERRNLIEDATEPLLELFSKHDARATFFVLGEVAKKSPAVVEWLVREGHEVALHGLDHKPLWEVGEKAFPKWLSKGKRIVERVAGGKVKGFRAPCFSLDEKTSWAFAELQKQEFSYDSSVFPIKTPLYGMSSAPRNPFFPSPGEPFKSSSSGKLIEFPLTVGNFAGLKVPLGGFYLRLFPLFVSRAVMRQKNRKGEKAILFLHPWETSEDTPRVKMPLNKGFVNYFGIAGMMEKIESILREFRFHSFLEELEERGLK